MTPNAPTKRMVKKKPKESDNSKHNRSQADRNMPKPHVEAIAWLHTDEFEVSGRDNATPVATGRIRCSAFE